MTPKEKARELVGKSMPLAHDWESDNEIVAIKIALLCVNEILSHAGTVNNHDVSFWYDVKKEIEQL